MSERKHELILASLAFALLGVMIICAAFDVPDLFAASKQQTEEETFSFSNERALVVEEEDTTPANSENGGKVNLNTATFEELTGLNEIGEERAKAIIEYRETYGRFLTAEEITNVYGIGESIYESIADRITAE